MACSNAAPCSSGSCPLKTSSRPPSRPGHTQRPPRIQRLVVGDLRRHDRTRRKRDLTGRFADRDARDLGIALGRRERRRGRDLIERQVAVAEGLVERRQLTQRLGRLGQPARAAVVAACDLRQPLRKRRAPRRLPIPTIVRPAGDLGKPLIELRLLLTDRQHLIHHGRALTLIGVVESAMRSTEHLFASYHADTPEYVSRMCRYAGLFTPNHNPPRKKQAANPHPSLLPHVTPQGTPPPCGALQYTHARAARDLRPF